MNFPRPSLSRTPLWLWVGVCVPLLLGLASLTVAPPMLNPDSAMGFLAWESHAKGAPWNHVLTPDPNNLNRDSHYFLTWWSPGQADLPGVFRYFGATCGQCIAISTLLGCWIQLAGSWLLAVKLGASRTAAGWFAMVSVLQWHSLFPFGHFRGGDMLLNAGAPWMLLIAWSTRDRPWTYLTSIPPLLLGGQYLKLSAVLLTGPLLLAGGLSNLWLLRRRPAAAATWAALASFLAAGSWWLFTTGFLQRGPSPSGAGSMQGDPLSLLAFSVAAPFLAATGGGSLIGRLFFWRGANVDELWQYGGWIVGPAAILTCWLFHSYLLRWLRAEHRRGIVLITAVGSLMLWSIYLRGSTVSTEDRFMRPSGTLLVIALALALDYAPARAAAVCRGLMLSIALFGVGSAVQRTCTLSRMPAVSAEGILQQHLTPQAISHLQNITQGGSPDSKLIYVPFAGLGLEVLRQRALVTDDIGFARRNRWEGRVEELIAVFPDAMEKSGEAQRVREQFVSYRSDEWRTELHGRWWFWHAGPAH